MKQIQSLLCIVSIATFSLLFVSCEGGPGGTDLGATAATGAATGNMDATGFLATGNAALTNWLDERFEVDYKHMTPQLIFDQVPLSDIYYQSSNLPTNAAPFNFSSKAVSRRELLKRISTHWNLDMSLVTDAAGTPSAVKVVGRG